MNLWGIPAIDQHAHNLLKPEPSARYPYTAAFAEAYDPDVVNYHVRHTFVTAEVCGTLRPSWTVNRPKLRW
jgi:hypothetical protein